MKKSIILILIGLSIAIGAQAQKKSGYVSSAELLEAMPERKAAQDKYEAYEKQISEEFNIMQKDLMTKYEDFDKTKATMSETMKGVKAKEIDDLSRRLQQFETKAQEDLQKKQAELLEPLFEKARKAIQDVGKEGGYDYIYDAQYLLYAKDSENVLPQVKAKLGIK